MMIYDDNPDVALIFQLGETVCLVMSGFVNTLCVQKASQEINVLGCY